MKKKLTGILLTAVMVFTAACGSSGTAANTSEASSETVAAETETQETETEVAAEAQETEIQVFIAASLNTVMQEIAANYNELHPEVKITFNADSSGTLLTQIEEGYACDIFFSAAQTQMNTLQDTDGLVVEGTRANVVNNQVVVVTYKGSETTVTGLADIANAESIALAGGSVPVGKYTRQAMVNLGMLPETDDVASITTEEISAALNTEISECGNVSKVLAAVAEASNEVGTTYYSDTYGYEDSIEILEYVSYDLTGNVIYPIAQVINDEADEAETAAAADFLAYVLSDESKAVFEAYYFDTNVE